MQSKIRHCLWLIQATCLELKSHSQFVAASAWCGCLWEGPSCTPRSTSFSTKHGGWLAKGPRYPDICTCLPSLTCFLLSSSTEKAFGSTWLSWPRFSVSHQIGVSGIYQTNTGSDLCHCWLWGHSTKFPRNTKSSFPHRNPVELCGRVGPQGVIRVQQSLSGQNRLKFVHVKGRFCTSQPCKGNMAPILEPYDSVSPKISQEPELSRVRLLGVRRIGQVDLSWEGMPVRPVGR